MTAAIEAAHGFRRATAASQRAAWIGAGITLAMAVVLISAPWIAGAALVLFVGVSFAIDGVRHAAIAAREGPTQPGFPRDALGAAGNLAVVALMLVFGHSAVNWTVAIAAGIRILGTAFNIAAAPSFTGREADDTVIADLGLTDDARLAKLGARMQAEEQDRVLLDVAWLAAFVGTLFAIHIGRMGLDQTTLGLLSPGVAVIGDLAVALVVAFAIVVPLKLAFRKATRGLERRAWQWSLGFAPVGRAARWWHAGVRWWLESRMRFAIRLRQARYSLPQAIGRGLQIGVPFAAIIVATIPVFGMSWYFDTENWAASIWNSWAESRTDIWRAAMVKAVVGEGLAREDASGFEVHPAGVGDGPFSFLVIGDTGEGDASQHVLRDQLLKAAEQEDVRFVVISSDVVYPTGAMKDYELRFWLPFKGVTKPVFAIPGNHDWYDALEAFTATFFEPRAARAAMHARIEVDNRLTGTTDETVDRLIAEAARLRREYGVPTGYQQGPFFQLQTATFALIAVDTGVLKQVDDEQLTWLRAALDRSDGKVVLALLGHPPLAGGLDQTRDNAPFAALNAAPSRAPRACGDGGRHARPRVLPGAPHGEWPGRCGALLRQRWRRRVSEFRDRAVLAGSAADACLGLLSDPRRRGRQDRSVDPVLEAPGVVVDATVRRVAVFGGRAVRRLRLQRRAVLSELPRNPCRTRRRPPPTFGPGLSMDGCVGPTSRCRQI